VSRRATGKENLSAGGGSDELDGKLKTTRNREVVDTSNDVWLKFCIINVHMFAPF
jgi:hypothetical protein